LWNNLPRRQPSDCGAATRLSALNTGPPAYVGRLTKYNTLTGNTWGVLSLVFTRNHPPGASRAVNAGVEWMEKVAGLAGVAIFSLILFGFLELLDLFHVNGPQLPQWAVRPVALFLAGFILSLVITAFWIGKSWYRRGNPPWIEDKN
jgi:hypothetical protein